MSIQNVYNTANNFLDKLLVDFFKIILVFYYYVIHYVIVPFDCSGTALKYGSQNCHYDQLLNIIYDFFLLPCLVLR